MLYAVNPVRPYCFIRIPILLQTSKPRIVKPIQFWTLFCFLIALAFTGGSSRSDVQSLAFLLPLSIIVCAIGLWTLELSHVKNNRYVLISCALTFFLVCVQLVPLPPEIWRWQSSMSNLLELAVGEVGTEVAGDAVGFAAEELEAFLLLEGEGVFVAGEVLIVGGVAGEDGADVGG